MVASASEVFKQSHPFDHIIAVDVSVVHHILFGPQLKSDKLQRNYDDIPYS